MSTHVVGFKPPDAEWKKMKAVWDSCKKAKIDVPREVEKFFNGNEPDDAGVELNQHELGSCIKKYQTDYCEGYEVDITKVPKDVKIIRFYNSY